MIQFDQLPVNCPYCNKEQKVSAESWPSWWATSCDGEIGGCNKIFIYRAVGGPRVVTRKVLGEE